MKIIGATMSEGLESTKNELTIFGTPNIDTGTVGNQIALLCSQNLSKKMDPIFETPELGSRLIHCEAEEKKELWQH
jgi:hypothetical protein